MAVAVAVVLWGFGNVLVKRVDVEGTTLACWRLAAAGVLLAAVSAARGRPLDVRTLRLAAPGGVTFGLNLAFFFSAVKLTTVANASVIVALQPAVLLLVVGPLFGELVTRRQLGLVAVAVAGVALTVLGATGTVAWNGAGDLLAVGALASWSAYFVLSKQARRELGALEYQAALSLVAAVVVAPIALLSDGLALSWGGFAAVMVVVAIPGSGHLLMNWSHAHVPLTTASSLTLAQPVVAATIAAAWLGEGLTPLQVLGMAVAVGALVGVVRNPVGSVTPPR